MLYLFEITSIYQVTSTVHRCRKLWCYNNNDNNFKVWEQVQELVKELMKEPWQMERNIV